MLFGDRRIFSIHPSQSRWISASHKFIKRFLDLILATLGLIALLPLFIAVALAVKTETRGPIFFSQRRGGLGGEEFVIYKFRTMTTMEDGDDVIQVTRNDPRVTRVGAFLRRTSIDELPQLLNIIKGNMSLVGPRPHPTALDRKYAGIVEGYNKRYAALPGLTGWAQVNGLRGETPKPEMMAERVRHDIWYIDNWSIWLDLQIIALTSLVILVPAGVSQFRKGVAAGEVRLSDEVHRN